MSSTSWAVLKNSSEIRFLKEGEVMREQLSKSLYNEHLERDTKGHFVSSLFDGEDSDDPEAMEAIGRVRYFSWHLVSRLCIIWMRF